MPGDGFDYLWRAPYAPPEDKGGAAPNTRRVDNEGMIIDYDVPVTLRDGVTMYVDVYRPADEAPAPPIIAWGPYGKHGHTRYSDVYPNWGGDQDTLSKFTAFEAPDAVQWTRRGYAIINPDPRGTWYSEGRASFLSPEEADDYYDVIEWAGTRPWSNGKVGLTGVSYLTQSQWLVAAMNPPHLAAINPYEGWSDSYREVVRHGGIPETRFWGYIPIRWGFSTTTIEDLVAETAAHPQFDDFWASKVADWSKIKVPAYVVASWSDQGMHTRGTLEAYKALGSERKWLEVHGRKKWAYYYEPDSIARQLAFFDHICKDIDNEVADWPAVNLEVREKFFTGPMKAENEYPIARTRYVPLYLDAADGSMTAKAPSKEASVTYDGEKHGDQPGGRADFVHTFEAPTDLIGHMKLKLWAAAESHDDMDLFVAIEKLGKDGEKVGFAFWTHFDDGPVALGWLRASHRELDEAKSTPQQPIQAHRRQLMLKPGEVVPMEIEIWPSGTHFDAGEGIRVTVQGSDIYDYEAMCDRHTLLINKGKHTLHTGGRYDAHLLIPVVPET